MTLSFRLLKKQHLNNDVCVYNYEESNHNENQRDLILVIKNQQKNKKEKKQNKHTLIWRTHPSSPSHLFLPPFFFSFPFFSLSLTQSSFTPSTTQTNPLKTRVNDPNPKKTHQPKKNPI